MQLNQVDYTDCILYGLVLLVVLTNQLAYLGLYPLFNDL